MYTAAWRAAWDLELLSAHKFVLLAYVRHRCDTCGLAWPGTPMLVRSTGLAERSVQHSTKILIQDNHLVVHAYPKGGRGRATQYIVMPWVGGLSTAPCGKCASFLANPAAPAGNS